MHLHTKFDHNRWLFRQEKRCGHWHSYGRLRFSLFFKLGIFLFLPISKYLLIQKKGVGSFVFAPAIKYLSVKYDWKITLIVLGCILLQCCFLGSLLKPVSKRPSKKRFLIFCCIFSLNLYDILIMLYHKKLFEKINIRKYSPI